MRRRLDLASALVHEPQVLFLDEPTTGLDPVSRKAIWEEVAALNAEGTTVFLTTQYLEEADQLADRVGIIDGGRIVAEGTPGVAQGRGRQAAPRARARRRRRPSGPRRSCARFGKLLPAKDGKLLVELERRRRRRRQGRPGARRGRDPGRVARPGRADARRRLRRQDGLPPRGRRRVPPSARPRPEPARSAERAALASTLRVIARARRALGQADLPPPAAAGADHRSSRRCCSRSRPAAPAGAVDLPGFPEVDGFLDFMLAGAMIQSTLLAGNSGGIALAVDIEMGFTDRLLAAPISRFAIVARPARRAPRRWAPRRRSGSSPSG